MVSYIYISPSLKTAPSDYTSVSPTNVALGPNQLSHIVKVTVVDDLIHEDKQQFFGSLSTTDKAVVLQPEIGNVNIIDNDCKNI